MASFVLNQAIETTTSEIEVTVARNDLPPGRHTFQLVVVDDSGNVSAPTIAEVIVRDAAKPTAVLDVPSVVEAGKSFVLSGKRSSDVGGTIVKYIWTRLS